MNKIFCPYTGKEMNNMNSKYCNGCGMMTHLDHDGALCRDARPCTINIDYANGDKETVEVPAIDLDLKNTNEV